jgi:GT2 family glycosyltransferase
MTALPTSVVIVSRGRGAELSRCLLAVSQLDHPAFEVIVVADPEGLAAVARSGLAGRIKTVPFDAPGISAARNAGIAAAAGELIAFLDDDAVPEPAWLRHLAGAIEATGAEAAAGYVRGRNGISFQSRAVAVDPLGRDLPLEFDGDAPVVPQVPAGAAVKTVGTNCAFRRDVLLALGGFDPAITFFMDETDLDLRLAAAGGRVAVAPLAEVHHAFAPSPRRRADRLPLDLADIGRSSARVMRRHAPWADAGRRFAELRAEQEARIARHVQAGNCPPEAFGRLLATLERGWAEGLRAPLDGGPWIARASPPAFLRFRPERPFGADLVLAGSLLAARRLRREAARAVREGRRTSLYIFDHTPRRHRLRFTADGVWEQSGGLYGASDRGDPPFRFWRFRARVERECARTRLVRATVVSEGK